MNVKGFPTQAPRKLFLEGSPPVLQQPYLTVLLNFASVSGRSESDGTKVTESQRKPKTQIFVRNPQIFTDSLRSPGNFKRLEGARNRRKPAYFRRKPQDWAPSP